MLSCESFVHVAVRADEWYDFVAALELDTHHMLQHLVLTLQPEKMLISSSMLLVFRLRHLQ